MAYPVQFQVEDRPEGHSRLTTFLRPLLAIPHILIIGGPVPYSGGYFGAGAFGVFVAATAFIAWFAILLTRKYPHGLWEFGALYVRWRTRASVYMALLRDEYPPFGEGEYPAGVAIPYPEESDRLTVFFRLFLVIPHLLVLAVLSVVWVLTTFIAWLSVLITRNYPQPLYRFSVRYLRWSLRVQAYALLLRDEYPPFALED